MKFASTTTLVLGAHTDDEYGCAGTISRLIADGTRVVYACFSPCEESVPDGFDRDVLKREVRQAVEVLGIAPDDLLLYDFPVRHFPAHRQAILEELVRLRGLVAPDLVLLPALSDIHQDHQVVAEEGLRAFKHATILGYELPMNTISFQHACFVPLSAADVERKIEHARVYESQAHKTYMQPEFLRSLAAVRGLQVNHPAAEAFEVIRMIVA
jgi:LmbE family N-acetylglucosaminyl deacetylase